MSSDGPPTLDARIRPFSVSPAIYLYGMSQSQETLWTQMPLPRRPKKWGFAAALALVVEHGRRARRKQVPPESRCPRCGHRGPTERDFGTRLLGGERRPQSWCRKCRTGAEERAEAPRSTPVFQQSLFV